MSEDTHTKEVITPWQALKRTLSAISSFIVNTAEAAEDIVQLASNEIAALEEGQQIRLDDVRDEREVLKIKRSAKRKELGLDQDKD